MLVYIACPYSGDVGQNVHNAIKIADALVECGHKPYIPLLTHFWHIVSPQPYQFWIDYDNEILARCDCVFRTLGQSDGADKEVKLAQKLGLPVFYNLYDIPI